MAWHEFAAFSSSNIAAARYDPELLLLEIEFHNGGRYHYYDVPGQVAQTFEQAASKGQFLAASIKGHYRYNRA
jgi:KTSC domain